MQGHLMSVADKPYGSSLVREYPVVENLIPNPSFEVDLTGWTLDGATFVANAIEALHATEGSNALHISYADSGHGRDYNALAVEDGEWYYVRADFYVVSGQGTLRIWDTAAQVLIKTTSGTGQQTLEGWFQATEDSSAWRCRLLTNVAGDFYVDAVRVVKVSGDGIYPADRYADGDQAGYEWSGTAHDSTTVSTGAIYVEDPTDFDAGEQIEIGAEQVFLTDVDYDSGKLTLETALVGGYGNETQVLVFPLATERVAEVSIDDEDETVSARVPHALWDKIDTGVRSGSYESVEVEFDTVGLIVGDVLGIEPVIDGTFINPATLPSTPSDGSAPASSPTPTVQGGLRLLACTWLPVSNADLVTYEVHVSTTNDFTPDATTKAGETPGTSYWIHRLPDGSALAYNIDYYVKLVATDADGSAAASTQGIAQLDPAGTDDFLAGSITAEKLAAFMAMATSMMAGTWGAERAEMGFGVKDDGAGNPTIDSNFIGFRGFDQSDLEMFHVDCISGEVYLRGRLDFGNGSRLLPGDLIEIQQQDASATFETPLRVQSTVGFEFGNHAKATWPSPTQEGSLLIYVVQAKDTELVTVPAGYTQAATNNSGGRLQVFYKANAGSEEGQVSLSWTSNSNRETILHLIEYSGVSDLDKFDVNIGLPGDPPPGVGPTALTTQDVEVWFAAIGSQDTDALHDGPADQSSPTNGWSMIRGGQSANIGCYVYDQIVSATGQAQFDITMSYAEPWTAIVCTFKAAPVGVVVPATGKLRMYAKDAGSVAGLYVVDEGGTEHGPIGKFSGAKAEKTTAQALTDSTWERVGCDTTEWDTDNYHADALHTDRFTAPYDGYYHVEILGEFASSAAGRRAVGIDVNQSGTPAPLQAENVVLVAGGTGIQRLPFSGDFFLNAGDYIVPAAYQSSGAALDLRYLILSIRYIGI